MTIEELLAREAIRDTIAAYTTSGDRLKIDAFVACFTEDAVMETDGVPETRAFRYEGRAAIRAWQERWLAGEGGTHGATFVRHHLSTSKIDLTGPDTARARTYWAAWTDIGPDHAGYYLDEFRKEGERWLIARRRVRMDWEAAESLFRQAVANTSEH
jgi:ketosteroid isomerase-like protein